MQSFFSFERADGINLAFSLLISFLIINEYLNDKFISLAPTKYFIRRILLPSSFPFFTLLVLKG